MQLLFWLLCLAVVAIWLTGWVFLIAERIAHRPRKKRGQAYENKYKKGQRYERKNQSVGY